MKTDRPAFEKVGMHACMVYPQQLTNHQLHSQNVKLALRGGSIAGFTFDKCLK